MITLLQVKYGATDVSYSLDSHKRDGTMVRGLRSDTFFLSSFKLTEENSRIELQYYRREEKRTKQSTKERNRTDENRANEKKGQEENRAEYNNQHTEEVKDKMHRHMRA